VGEVFFFGGGGGVTCCRKRFLRTGVFVDYCEWESRQPACSRIPNWRFVRAVSPSLTVLGCSGNWNFDGASCL